MATENYNYRIYCLLVILFTTVIVSCSDSKRDEELERRKIAIREKEAELRERELELNERKFDYSNEKQSEKQETANSVKYVFFKVITLEPKVDYTKISRPLLPGEMTRTDYYRRSVYYSRGIYLSDIYEVSTNEELTAYFNLYKIEIQKKLSEKFINEDSKIAPGMVEVEPNEIELKHDILTIEKKEYSTLEEAEKNHRISWDEYKNITFPK